MQVQTLEGLERQVDLVLSIDSIEADVKKELKQVARKAKIQGFRPGKAPLSVIERSHGPSVRYDVINRHVGQAFDSAVRENNLRVAGAPEVSQKEEPAPAGQLAFTAKFEVFPTIELPDFSTLEVTQYHTQVGDAEVERTIDILRKQRATYTVEEGRAAQDGDRVKVDFVGKIDGEEFAGGKATDFVFILGQASMLPEFEAATQGLKAGESKTFDLSFPEDYQGKEVAGKTAQFTITVKEVAQAHLPEVDAEFAKSLGDPKGDIEKLKNDIKENIERESKNRTLLRTKNSVFDALLKAVSFDVPKTLIQNEIQNRIAAAREDLAARGLPNADKFEIPADLFKDEAERRVRLGLLVADIVDKEKLSSTPEQVRARIEELAKNYEKPEQVVAYYLTDRQRRAEIEAVVLEDNLIDFILSKAKVTQEEVPFDELMGQA